MFRKSWLIILLIFFFAPAFEAKAADLMGAPTAELKKGQWNVGLIYSFSETDIELSGYGVSETIEEVKTNRYWANMGYGIEDWWEVNLRLGAADAEASDIDFDGSTDFTLGFNTKFTFYSNEELDWGLLFQFVTLESDDDYNYDLSAWGLGTSQSVEIDAYEIQIAFGPTWKRECWKLYGGPFFHLVNGDLDFRAGGTTLGFDIEEDSVFGGYIGSQIDLTENAELLLEVQLSGGGYGIGTGVIWKF
jgi:hypothetical protein